MTKEDKKFVRSATIDILGTIFEDNRDAENICDRILNKVVKDIEETADPEYWHEGDVRIAIARVLKHRLRVD